MTVFIFTLQNCCEDEQIPCNTLGNIRVVLLCPILGNLHTKLKSFLLFVFRQKSFGCLNLFFFFLVCFLIEE